MNLLIVLYICLYRRDGGFATEMRIFSENTNCIIATVVLQ